MSVNVELSQVRTARGKWLSPGRQRALLLLGCLLLSCLWCTYVPLTGIDEIRYSEATREMLESGDYMIPHFNYAPRYQKPILIYWLQAGSVRAFGLNEVALRLPSALAYLATVLLLHAFLLRWLPAHLPGGRRRAHIAAFLGAAALATMPLFVIWSRSAVTDVVLTFFITASILSLLQAELLTATGGDRRNARAWYLWAAVAAGFAMLTKGVVGVAVPALVWLVYHLSRRNLRAEARRTPWVTAVALFLLIAAPWYIATYFVDGPGFLTHFFVKEHLERFTVPQEGHGTGNILLGLLPYLPIALVFTFPYSASLLRELLVPFAGDARLAHEETLVRLRRFGWAWIGAVIGLFSLSSTQLPSYIQSIAPGAALLFALHILGRYDTSRTVTAPLRRRRWAAGVETFLLCFFGVAIAGGLAYSLSRGAPGGRPWTLPYPHPIADIVAGLLVAAGLLFLLAVLLRVPAHGVQRLHRVMAAWGLLLGVLLFGVAPLYVRSVYLPIVRAGLSLRSLPPDEVVLTYYDTTPEELVFYSRHHVRFLSRESAASLQEIKAALAERPVSVQTSEAGLRELRHIGKPTTERHFGSIVIVRLQPR